MDATKTDLIFAILLLVFINAFVGYVCACYVVDSLTDVIRAAKEKETDVDPH